MSVYKLRVVTFIEPTNIIPSDKVGQTMEKMHVFITFVIAAVIIRTLIALFNDILCSIKSAGILSNRKRFIRGIDSLKCVYSLDKKKTSGNIYQF